MKIARGGRRGIGVASAAALVATGLSGCVTATEEMSGGKALVQWGPVVDLTPVVEAAFSADAVVHPDGSVTVVWIGPSWDRRRVHLRHRPAGGEWQRREAVPGTRGASEAAVGAGRDGAVVLAWAVEHRVEVSRREVGRSWSTARVLHRTPRGVLGTRPASLVLEVGQRGHAVVAWETRDDDQDGVYARSRIQMAVAGRNGVWRSVRTASGEGWHPEVGVGPAARATVTWQRGEGRRDTGVAVSVHRPGAGWRTRSLTRQGEHAGWPQLALSPVGTAVSWTYDRGGRRGVAARRWWPRTGWTTVRRTEVLPARGAWLDAGLDASGRLTLTSARWDGPLWVVDLTRRGRWSDGVRIGGPVRDQVAVVTDPRGNVVLGWSEGRGDSSRLQVAVRPVEGHWVRRDLDPAERRAFGPVLAIDGAGRAIAVWSDARPSDQSQLRARGLSVVAGATTGGP